MNMDKPKEFVEDWNIIQTLGEGAYGEVKLLVHKDTEQAVAVKIVDLCKHRDAADCVNKEERIHRLLVHPNIIKLFGKREEPQKVYIFLEYAAGGELFNKIEPDLGMHLGEAQSYMKQLLCGVDYLHSRGIAHRDLKPENILLDEHGNVKISDFGMATVFRLRGRERLLDKKCGTLPYVAPEVLKGPYHAVPSDLWSCGIIFVAMLAGELPWDEPTENSLEYQKWKKESNLLTTPWSKLETVALSMARKLLSPEPSNRPSIQQILEHRWIKKDFHYSNGSTNSTGTPSVCDDEDQIPCVAFSQPLLSASSPNPKFLALLLQTPSHTKPICFSQPIHNDDLILGSQLQFTQSVVTHSNFQRLIKRMTRFFVWTNFENTISSLCSVLDKLHYMWNSDQSGVVTISTMDSRKTMLVFKAILIDMDGKLLLDFRLSKGCGLDFKRRFVKLKYSLKDIILNDINQV